jgi:Protein kinase domain
VEPLLSDDPAQAGRYRVHARLGAGGMGTVYLAFTPGGRPVALKMIRPELAGHADFRHRFRQEVETARRVHGLYTAQVLDADPDASPPWLVTAFVPGPSLQEAVTAHGPLPVDTALVLMAGVAEALEQIHGAGVIHRDLKPSNVVLSPDGPRVIDFGIARAVNASVVTGAGLRIGSPNYMAPEQVDDSPVGPGADVFALGSVAAFAALGRPPFGEGGPLPVMYRVLHEPADLAGCPAPLRGIVERCLAKRAADRPSPADIIDQCRAVTAGRTGQIAQPWLPPGVLAALAERPLGSPAAAAAPGPRPASAAALAGPAPAAPPATILDPPQRGIAASGAVPARPAARLRDQPATRRPSQPPTRSNKRRAGCVAVLLALLVLPVAGLIWLADHIIAGGQSAPGRTAATSWLAGTWTGSADQPNGVVTHWTAELTFSRSGRTGTFRFPSLGCSGTLVVNSATSATASVSEHLARNPDKVCASRGIMTLSRSGSGLHMNWRDASNRANVATGYLRPW